MRAALRQARAVIHHDARAARTTIPTFLCPILLRTPLPQRLPSAQNFSTFSRRRHEALAEAQHHAQANEIEPAVPEAVATPVTSQALPRACPGCGAPAQQYDKNEAGYYNADRKQVRAYLRYEPEAVAETNDENDVYAKALADVDPAILEEMGVERDAIANPENEGSAAPETPMCDRCHNLIHHMTGTPIHHPSVDAIQQTIAESPHRRNHIYHVVDAADFPLSLVPNLQSALRLPRLRTQNRRAKHKGWVGENRIAQVSFIITRADLLAPLKEQADKLLPYMQDVLRDALGRVNKTARLGNVHMVSAKRGWWTKKVKEDIWDRGGAGWMVGKVNVGKSNLFEVVFPKGRGADYQDVRKLRTLADKQKLVSEATTPEQLAEVEKELEEESAENERRRRQPVLEPEETLPEEEEDADLDANSLLPPLQPYTPYPVLPLASPLPGTTASPIRIPFGRNRGELIDLPGLARTSPDLTTFVKPSEHWQLVMKSRVAAERYVIKPGQSLLLGGGLVRITPVTEDTIFLVHPFTPLEPHLTSTTKALAFQSQRPDSQSQSSPFADPIPNIPTTLLPTTFPQIKSAGTVKLKWDATKQLAGPLTSSTAGKMRPENLPFTVWSTDVLIEGVGWVEISAQVRKPRGWQPVGLVKKDPNHKKLEREKKLEEERAKRQRNYLARQAENGASEEGDAFDRAGLGSASPSSSSAGTAEARYRQRELEAEEQKRAAALEFVDDMVHQYPEVEIFTPLGKYIGSRRPMCGSVIGGPKQVSSRDRKARPRRSMVSVKTQRKPGGGAA